MRFVIILAVLCCLMSVMGVIQMTCPEDKSTWAKVCYNGTGLVGLLLCLGSCGMLVSAPFMVKR